MEQRFEPLNADDTARLEAQRTWVRDHYNEDTRHEDACRAIERVKNEGA